MKQTLAITVAALAISVLPAGAQTVPAESATPIEQHNSNTGTAPENMGKAGWTGGRQDSPGSTTRETTGSATPSISDDTEYATGVDLKGPPTTFPANKTPE